MNAFRRLLAVSWLALALLVGQHAAVVHDLGHATEQSGKKVPGTPGHQACDKCFASAQLAGAVGATIGAFPSVLSGAESFEASFVRGAPGAARFAFLSRAPPTLL